MTEPSPGSGLTRRRRGPSLLRLFLGAAAVLGWVFDASLVLRRARRGPWRAEVAEGSMAPALLPGDWLLLDPTGARWPRPGSIVVIREPVTGILAIKRVAARGRRAGGTTPAAVGPAHAATPPIQQHHRLGPREAWLLGDAPSGSIDSRVYGPLDADAFVARAWLRYGPPRRIGRIR
jgi:signal peptidase I